MAHGLHTMSHTVVADGSGRDASIFCDQFWRKGANQGYGNVPCYHPIFSTGKKVPAYVIDHGQHPRAAAIKANPECADLPNIHRLPGNSQIMWLPKSAIETKSQSLTSTSRSASAPSLTASTKPAKWRTREMQTSFDSWHLKHPRAEYLGRTR